MLLRLYKTGLVAGPIWRENISKQGGIKPKGRRKNKSLSD